MAIFTPEQRQQTAERITGLLSEDDRIEGVALVGSLVSGADRWSDVDLMAVVREQSDPAAVAADWVRRLYEHLPVVHHFETEFGATLVRGFLLESLLEVDVAFEPATSLSIWGPARVTFDRSGRLSAAARSPAAWQPDPPDWPAHAGFAWHDVVHSCIAVHRGRLWQALWYLERVRNRTLALASERRGLYADFFDYVDDLPPDERALETTLVPSLEPEPLLRALEAATRALLAELRRGDSRLADRLQAPLLELIRLES